MFGPIMGGSPRLRFVPEKVAIAGDGNSIMRGDGSTGGETLTVQLARLAPLNGQILIVNHGVDGQRTYQMTSNATDVNASYEAGKANFLLILEGFNDMIGAGNSVATAFENMRLYCQARLALNPDRRLILILCTPFYPGDQAAQSETDSHNAKLDEFNALVRANKAALGYTALVDTRAAGSPFAIPDYLPATFKATAYQRLFKVETNNKLLHPNNVGYGELALLVAGVLKRLRAR